MTALMGRQWASMAAFWSAAASASPGGRAVETGGVTAAIVPAAPERSVANSAICRRPDAQLPSVLAELAGAYEESGVDAWTVWIPAGSAGARDALTAAGHRLDGTPVPMGCALDELALPEGPEPELDPRPSLADVARINDRAYGFPGSFARVFAGAPPPGVQLYVARADGEAASCLMTLYCEGDCHIALVATEVRRRKRGLATGLMALALREAREAGCTTTTLQATANATSAYERLGYRRLGGLEMWERRRIPPPRELQQDF